MTNLKKFILENCLTVQGKFNNRATDLKWWEIRNHVSIYDEILEVTKFLPDDSLMTRRVFHIVNDLYEVEKCVHCTVNDRIFINYTEGYSQFCSRPCSIKSDARVQKIQATNLEKYGCKCSAQNKDIQDKIKKTNLERYGVEHSFQSTQMKDKSKVTKLERYGDENYVNMERIKQSNLEKYGYEYTTQVPSIIDKMQESKMDNYNPLLRDKEWLIEQNKTKNISKIAEELGLTQRSVYLWMLKHEIPFLTHASKDFKAQREMYDYLLELGVGNVIYNDRRAIGPKHLDIFVPDLNIGIEHNGIYWHREDKVRHIEKLNLCLDKGIKLLQFWDYQWIINKDICKSIIKSNLGLNERIYARKCKIVEISYKEYESFMDDNHIHGSAMASIRYGLEYNGELVACISFSKPRSKGNREKYDYELIRYANKINFNVVGGFSRLFKKANLNNIISYCDLMLFNGNMYKESGFEQLPNTDVGYFYSNNKTIKPREFLQKHKLADNLKNYNGNISAAENIFNEGWYKIWNCGNGVWVYNK